MVKINVINPSDYYMTIGHISTINVIHGDIWSFPKIGVPLNHPFVSSIFVYKPTIVGVPPFMETTIE